MPYIPTHTAYLLPSSDSLPGSFVYPHQAGKHCQGLSAVQEFCLSVEAFGLEQNRCHIPVGLQVPGSPHWGKMLGLGLRWALSLPLPVGSDSAGPRQPTEGCSCLQGRRIGCFAPRKADRSLTQSCWRSWTETRSTILATRVSQKL